MSTAPVLPERRKRTGLIVGIIAAIVVIAIAVVTIVIATASGGNAADGKTISIGVTDKSQPYWKTFSKLAKDKYGVTVELVNFSDYSQPNPALSQKQLDLNEFQHIQYLADYNVSNDDDLQPIAPTAIYPLPLYSTQYTKPSELPDGAKVAIPNDAINQARGLLVLQAAKLVTLKNGGSAFSTTADIESSKIEVVALDASQTAGALQNGSVVAAVVNNNFAVDAGLSPKQAIFQDDPDSDSAAPYVNIFVARKADANNELYQKVARLYQDETVRKQVLEANGGSAVFRTSSVKELQDSLAKVEDDARAARK